MSSIKDEIRIRASAEEVYAALSRQEGYRGWWNKAGNVQEKLGGEADLHFVKDGHPVNMRFRIDELTPNQCVRWSCVDHDFASWIGTTLTWRLKPQADSVLVTLDHDGFKDDDQGAVVQGWRHFMGSLKSYVETGAGQPW